MNYNFHWWFFLCRFFAMVHICNFVPENDVFWCFTDLVIILSYTFFTTESLRITVVEAFSSEDVVFLTMSWETGRDHHPELNLLKGLIKSFCSWCWFSFQFFFQYFKMFDEYKVVKIFKDTLKAFNHFKSKQKFL